MSETNEPIQDIFNRMSILEQNFKAADAFIFPYKHEMYDWLDGIAAMAKEIKRQIELKG